MPSKNSRKKGYKNINMMAVIMCLIAVLVVVLVLNVGNSSGGENSLPDVSQDTSVDTSDSSDDASVESSEADVSKPTEIRFLETVVATDTYHTGDLIVVNPSHPMASEPTEEIVVLGNEKTSDYKVGSLNVKYPKRLIPTLNELMKELRTNVSSNAFTITRGYRTFEEQQDAHDSPNNKNGREPEGGRSDLNTGLSFAAWVYPSEQGTINQGKFAWLPENCHKYGFILRYPDGKSSLTGIDASNDAYITYRYVGVPHSYLIYVNNYCLEEYVEFAARFSPENPYAFNNGTSEYLIYYIPASDGENTTLLVPEDYNYTISGDNIGGFIITVIK